MNKNQKAIVLIFYLLFILCMYGYSQNMDLVDKVKPGSNINETFKDFLLLIGGAIAKELVQIFDEVSGWMQDLLQIRRAKAQRAASEILFVKTQADVKKKLVEDGKVDVNENL